MKVIVIKKNIYHSLHYNTFRKLIFTVNYFDRILMVENKTLLRTTYYSKFNYVIKLKILYKCNVPVNGVYFQSYRLSISTIDVNFLKCCHIFTLVHKIGYLRIQWHANVSSFVLIPNAKLMEDWPWWQPDKRLFV